MTTRKKRKKKKPNCPAWQNRKPNPSPQGPRLPHPHAPAAVAEARNPRPGKLPRKRRPRRRRRRNRPRKKLPRKFRAQRPRESRPRKRPPRRPGSATEDGCRVKPSSRGRKLRLVSLAGNYFFPTTAFRHCP